MKQGHDCVPQMTCLLNRLLQGTNNILPGELKFPMFVRPSLKVLAEGAAGDSQIVSVDQVVLEQIRKDLCHGHAGN